MYCIVPWVYCICRLLIFTFSPSVAEVMFTELLLLNHDEISKNLTPINFGIIMVWLLSKYIYGYQFVLSGYKRQYKITPCMASNISEHP